MTEIMQMTEMMMTNELVRSDSTDPKGRAVQLLALGFRPVRVAREIGIARNTLWAWRREPGFRNALATARRELWQDTLAQLRALAGKALQVIAEGLGSEDEKVRLTAAFKLIELGLRSPLPPSCGPVDGLRTDESAKGE